MKKISTKNYFYQNYFIEKFQREATENSTEYLKIVLLNLK